MKDRVKNAGGLPSLPQQAVLQDALAGTYAELRWEGLGRVAAREADTCVPGLVASGRGAVRQDHHCCGQVD